MKFILITFLLLLVRPVFADSTDFAAAGDPNTPFYLVLTKTPCPPDLLARAPAGVAMPFYLARERFGGREIRACWAAQRPVVLLFDEEGDQGVLPMSVFRPVSGA